MAANDALRRVDSPFGEVGLLAPLVPDVALMHAPVADRDGNIALHPPLLEGVWGALAARRGAIVTVEKIVDDVRPWSHLVRIPAHRVLAVVECPMGAHPGGLYTGDLPVDGYGEDYDFWVDGPRRDARATSYDAWIRHWVLDVETQEQWLDAARRRARRGAAREGRSRLVARRRGRVSARSRRARRTRGNAPRCGARAISRTASRRPDARRGARGRGRREPRRRGSACSSRATRAATCSSPPRSGCGATTRRSPTRSCSTTATSRPRRCSATRRWCSARSSAAPARRRSVVSAARRSTGRQHQLHVDSSAARSSSARAAATTSRAPRPSASSSRR